MQTPELIVRNIIGEEKDGVSRVTVSTDLFKAINQSIRARFNRVAPMLTFVGKGDEGGNGIRVFSLKGKNDQDVELYTHYDRNTGRLFLFMKTEDAKAHLMSVAEERAAAPKLPFNVQKFDLDIVASAGGEAATA